MTFSLFLDFLPRQQKATPACRNPLRRTGTAFGRDVAPLGREVGATGFARGAPRDYHHSIIPEFQLENIVVLVPGSLVFNLLGSLWNRPLRDKLDITSNLHYIPDGLFNLFF